MQKSIDLRFSIVCVIIVAAAVSRLIPHTLNFSPLGAMAIFGGAYFAHKWQAILIPILATWISDIFINNYIYGAYYPEFTFFYEGFYWQYGTYALIAILSIGFMKKVNFVKVVSASLLASVLFFIITNFGCWIGSSFYTQDWAGLMQCYAAGVPFFKGTLSGDLVYSFVLFGAYALAQKTILYKAKSIV